MHSLTSQFILGYHGCDKEDGERILEGEAFKIQENDYDWLGLGIYFWENNPARALQFAQEKQKRQPEKIKTPFVVGAVLNVGFCLDMTTQNAIAAVKTSHKILEAAMLLLREEMPENKLGNDFLLRYLDCQVIQLLHRMRMGDENAGFFEKTHTQIAIRNEACIKEVFRVRNL